MEYKEEDYPSFMTFAHVIAVGTCALMLESSIHQFKPIKLGLCLVLMAWYAILGVCWIRKSIPAGVIYSLFACIWGVCAYLRYLLDYA